jgi:mono/diheme cytochrome c family protein
MLKSSFVLLFAACAAVSIGVAQQPTTTIRPVPIKPISAASGEQMYHTYCASCHGANGTGNGPAAPALKVKLNDLTMLSQKNGGSFPEGKVVSALRFGVENSAHGNTQMPIWGDLFKTIGPSTDSVNQRISNLSDYLKKIQK